MINVFLLADTIELINVLLLAVTIQLINVFLMAVTIQFISLFLLIGFRRFLLATFDGFIFSMAGFSQLAPMSLLADSLYWFPGVRTIQPSGYFCLLCIY
jgi:hypothetical protein